VLETAELTGWTDGEGDGDGLEAALDGPRSDELGEDDELAGLREDPADGLLGAKDDEGELTKLDGEEMDGDAAALEAAGTLGGFSIPATPSIPAPAPPGASNRNGKGIGVGIADALDLEDDDLLEDGEELEDDVIAG
jgi:hypothetical protein